MELKIFFASLESIAKFNKTKKYDNIYIISSMNPLKNNISDKKIDSLFLNLVKMIECLNLYQMPLTLASLKIQN